MSFLFQIQNKTVYPNPETLLVYPFGEIWERDESPNKETAIKEFTYIEFMTSMLKSNPYREYPEDKKGAILIKDIIRDTNWEPDNLIREGMDVIVKWQEEGSISYTYWMANKIAAEKLKSFFLNFDMNERNFKTLNPVYKPKDITTAITDAEKMLTTLNSLKSKVDEEIFENLKNKSGKTISPFAKVSR